ncbi:acetyl-CoA carboxylase, carboxyl transferase, alpha subunit [Bordetella pertussis STO1-CHOC-0017]|nr:acetyl-CoA carboxylase, carboxyl transferase, alpha subunit [Bordetella pertussis STO1-CHOC-0017]
MRNTFLEFEQPLAELENKIEQLRYVQADSAVDISDEIGRLQQKSQNLAKEIYGKLTPWQTALVARHPQRPYTLDYVREIFTDFHELHGDRMYADDQSIVGGLARFNGSACMVIGHQKGRDTKERAARNFGMPRPEGYRKALRLMRLAEKFRLPIFTFIDTPGAYPGIGAEERGQSEAIGRNLYAMGRAKGAGHLHRDRRGRFGRRAGHRGRQRRADAAVRNLFGDFARRLRVHPVAQRRQGARGGRGAGHHRAAPEGPGPGRPRGQRAGRRRPPRPARDGAPAAPGPGRRPAPAAGPGARAIGRPAPAAPDVVRTLPGSPRLAVKIQ